MIPLGPVVARSRVGVERAAAWTYLVEQDRRAEWWPELQLDARVGGTVAERWSEGEGDDAVSRDAAGVVDVWVEGHAIGFTWREAGDDRDTAVLVTLRTQGLDTGITVTETGFDALPAAAERAAASQEGWQVLLRDLVTALEQAQSAGAFGERDAAPVAAAAVGALEVVAPEIDGELEDGALADTDARAESSDEELELEAEPAVGDHPELETGPVAVVTDEPTDLDETVQIDRDELDRVRGAEVEAEVEPEPEVEPELETEVEPEPEAASEMKAEREDPEEPDFDTLIRGN